MADNNWHTGKPTEEGDYLCAYKIGKNTIEYGVRAFIKIRKLGMWSPQFIDHEILAWIPIEPYKED